MASGLPWFAILGIFGAERVKTLINDNKDINFIHHTTNIARPVIKQYLQIINKYVKEL